MNFKLIRTTLLLLPLSTLCLFSSQSFGQNNTQNLLNKEIDSEFENTTLLYVLDSIRQTYKLSILFEVADSGYISGNPIDLNKYDINIKRGKLKDVLDSIIKQRPNYKWEIIDGVINFVPISNRNPLIEKLLNTQIKSFSLNSYTFISEVDDKLAELPEIVLFLKLNNIELNKFYDVSVSSGSKFVKNIVDLSQSNTTFKELLNNIVKKSPNSFRIVHIKTFEDEGKTKKILYF
jgi:hypothetical protein